MQREDLSFGEQDIPMLTKSHNSGSAMTTIGTLRAKIKSKHEELRRTQAERKDESQIHHVCASNKRKVVGGKRVGGVGEVWQGQNR